MSTLPSRILVVNGSKRVTDAEASQMADAVNAQIRDQVAPAWGRLAVAIEFASDPGKVAPTDQVLTLLDTPDQDGVLGYHFETNDQVLGKVFASPVLDNGGTVLGNKDALSTASVSSVLSHEVVEAFGDPDVNLFADGPTIEKGSSYAVELGDPVEGDGYIVSAAGKETQVSNFVLPAWFDPEDTTGPFDFLGNLKAPFSMVPSGGGYLVVRNGPGTEVQVFGEGMPAWKRALKSATGRGAKRIAKK